MEHVGEQEAVLRMVNGHAIAREGKDLKASAFVTKKVTKDRKLSLSMAKKGPHLVEVAGCEVISYLFLDLVFGNTLLLLLLKLLLCAQWVRLYEPTRAPAIRAFSLRQQGCRLHGMWGDLIGVRCGYEGRWERGWEHCWHRIGAGTRR